MPEYGLTSTGPNIKRLDVIEDEIHTALSEAWGVNTRQNPESFLCHLIRNIADQIADMWVYGSDVYYSQFPYSAEGKNLDTAVQYGGIVREAAQRSYYRILCTGIDGTTIPAGTIIASDTNPPVNLTIDENAEISRTSFNKVKIVPTDLASVFAYSVVIDGYSISQTGPDVLMALALIAHNINNNIGEYMGWNITATVNGDETAPYLLLEEDDPVKNHSLALSENLTTETVGSVITFATVDDGDIYVPDGVINKIVRSVVGLQSVVNVGDYIAGQLQETDTELRQSYVDKIFKRSSSMIESIRSNILDRVQGVETCAVYENDTNETDDYGRPPHSVEVVADGTFDENVLAQTILDTKAGGIATYGSNEVVIPGDYGEPIPIYYNKPQPVYIWYDIGVKFNEGMSIPLNYVALVENTIIECMDKLKAGDDVTPQRFLQSLYEKVPGVDYFDVGMYSTTNSATTPSAGQYTEKMVSITPRQRAVTDKNRINVEAVDDT